RLARSLKRLRSMKAQVRRSAQNARRSLTEDESCPMLSQEEFLGLIKAAGSDFYPPDDEQAKAVYADPRADLFIVAGPGTGKTSCLSFRALYLIFVAGFGCATLCGR